VGTLASFAVWLVGTIAEMKNIHRQFQANTIKKRSVLSLFFLGCRVINKQAIQCYREDYHKALFKLQQQFKEQCAG
jgi:hypothetical protein